MHSCLCQPLWHVQQQILNYFVVIDEIALLCLKTISATLYIANARLAKIVTQKEICVLVYCQ